MELRILHYFLTVAKEQSFTRAAYLDDAVGALNVKLTGSDIAYLEELYIPHPIIGAISHNPEQGVILIDEKK